MITKPYSSYAAEMSCAKRSLSAALASSVGTVSDICRLLCLPTPGCRSRRMPNARSQCASAILMVRPRHFGYNAETAITNRFQEPGGSVLVPEEALTEFDAFAAALAS